MKSKGSVQNVKGKLLPPIHQWRACPYGKHWVKSHPMRVPPSTKNPTGMVTTRIEHCARNPSGKDQIYPDEIIEISNSYFKNLKNKPCPLDLGLKISGVAYDEIISGWTKYWNDILRPSIPLDSNVVKALIHSESNFNTNALADKKNRNSARGLMQITNQTRVILGDEKGEIKDHYLTVTREELNEPTINICAGVRWLFQKQKLASGKLGRAASWLETIEEFKGCYGKSEKVKLLNMKKYLKSIKQLDKCIKK